MSENSTSGGVTFYRSDGTVISTTADFDAPALKAPPVPKPVSAPPAQRRDARPKPPVNSVDPDAPIEQQADDLADMIHEKFMYMLRDRLSETGGSLNEDDVEELSREFRENLGEIREVFLNAVDSHTRSKMPDREYHEREAAFERLMIQRFEPRFAPDHIVQNDPTKLSRRMLPGFFNALSLLLGPQRLNRYQEKSRLIKNVLEDKMGSAFTWSKLHNTSHARKIALMAQIDVARHFENLDKRTAWLVALVNSNMIPTSDHTPSGGWSFTEHAARSLLRDLFADLASALGDKISCKELEREIGRESIVQLRGVLRQLY